MWNSPVTLSGIVTDSSNKGDSGKLIEIFTNNGPVKVYAAYARRLSSRLLPLTRLFSFVNAECVRNGDLYILKDGKQIAFFENIERDVIKFSIAADVIKNIRIITQNSNSADKFYAMLLVLLQRLNVLADYDSDKFAILTATLKFYIYVLAYMGIDVPACAEEERYSEELKEICRYLKGKRVSDALQDECVFETAESAYRTLADIYLKQFDIILDKSIIL